MLLSDLSPLIFSGLLFALDSSSIAPPLHLTNSALTVTFRDSGAQAGGRDLCGSLPQVCADVKILRGQYYWEVDVCNSALYRIGKLCGMFVLFTEIHQMIWDCFSVSPKDSSLHKPTQYSVACDYYCTEQKSSSVSVIVSVINTASHWLCSLLQFKMTLFHPTTTRFSLKMSWNQGCDSKTEPVRNREK